MILCIDCGKWYEPWDEYDDEFVCIDCTLERLTRRNEQLAKQLLIERLITMPTVADDTTG